MQTYKFNYIPGLSPYLFQETQDQLFTHQNKTNAKIISGGNGFWTLVVPPYRMIHEYIDGEHTRSASPDKFLHDRGVQRITKKCCEMLCVELNKRVIKFDELI